MRAVFYGRILSRHGTAYRHLSKIAPMKFTESLDFIPLHAITKQTKTNV